MTGAVGFVALSRGVICADGRDRRLERECRVGLEVWVWVGVFQLDECGPLAEVGVPVVLRPLPPQSERLCLVGGKLVATETGDLQKMLNDAVEVDVVLTRKDLNQSKVRRMMAQDANRVKADQFLDTSLVVVAPGFVAIEPPCRPADATHIALVGVHFLPQLVPLGLLHLLAETLLPTTVGNQVDTQL